jgi:hypothetical protein
MGTNWLRLLLPVVVLDLIFFGASTAFAGCTVPFRVSAGELDSELTASVQCTGPWSRSSGCTQFFPGDSEDQFYCADDSVFSMYGQWSCAAYLGLSCGTTPDATADFCVQTDGPNPVELDVAGAVITFGITVEATVPCDLAETVAHLGHAGATASKTAVGRSAPRDRDTFAFDGSAGEKVVVALAKEGTAGHTGDAAVLRVLAAGDALLDEARGPLPLELDVELPATGKVQVVIEEAANAASSGTGAAAEGFRGHYLLSVTPDLGAEGLLLEPQPDVEP